jgi:hypothetical protein
LPSEATGKDDARGTESLSVEATGEDTDSLSIEAMSVGASLPASFTVNGGDSRLWLLSEIVRLFCLDRIYPL